MSRIETLLTETLRDPERALPSWPDPAGRVRAARAAQRRRRSTAMAGLAAVVATAVVAVPLLRDGEPRTSSGIVSRPPAAVVTGRFPPAPGRRFGRVVASGDVVFALEFETQSPGTIKMAHERIPMRFWRITDRGGDLSGTVVGSGPGPHSVTIADGRLWSFDYSGHEGFGQLAVLDVATGTLARGNRPFLGGGASALLGAPGLLWTVVPAGGLGLPRGISVERRSPETGKVVVASRTLGFPDRGSTLAFDGTHLWLRATDVDAQDRNNGSVLLRLDPTTLGETGRVKLPGSLYDGAIAAGAGKVWATVATTSEVMTTAGGVVMIDATTLAVEKTIETPYALKLGYGNGAVWLAGTKLARIDAATGELDGEPIDLGDVPSGFAVDGDLVWIVDETGVVRYDGNY